MRARLSTIFPLIAAALLFGTAGQAFAVGRYVLAWWRDVGYYETGGNHVIRVYVFDEAGNPLVGRNVYTSWGVLQAVTSSEVGKYGWTDDIIIYPDADRDVLIEDPGISDVSPLFSSARPPHWGHYVHEVGFMYKADVNDPGTYDTSTYCTYNPRDSTETDSPYTKSLIYNSIDCTFDTSDEFWLGTWSDEFNQTFTVPADVQRIMGVNVHGVIGGVDKLTITVKIKEGGPTGPVICSRSSYEVYDAEVFPFRNWQWIPFGVSDCPVTPGGTYCLTLTRGGGLNAYHTADVYSGGQYYEGTTPFPGQDLVGFVLGMAYEEPAVGRIVGLIEDTDGLPVGDAVVSVSPGSYETRTQVDGTYLIDAVEPGTYTVESWKPGLSRESQAGVVVVADQDTVVNLTLTPLVNLLANPGFETGDLTGWTTFLDPVSVWSSFTWAIPSYSGTKYAGSISSYDTTTGGFYQRVVGVQPGEVYTAAGWFFTDSWSGPPDRGNEYPSNCRSRIGLSPSGSVNPESPDIIWSDEAWSHNHWSPFYVEAAATDTAVTVFLEYTQQWAYQWNKNAFDDLWLSGPGLTATSPTLGPGWHLISLPAEPNDPSPPVVFSGISIDGALYRWDPGTASYVIYQTGDPGAFGDCRVGEGYWLYLTTPATISYLGAPLGGTQQIALPFGGWRMVGQPHVAATALADCTVTDLGGGGGTQSYYDAALGGWLAGRLYYYDPAAGGYLIAGPDPWNASNALTPWSGYWLWSADMNLGLNVP